MLRRSFRFGLLFGLLGGALAAALKAVQGHTTSTASTASAPVPDAEPIVRSPRPERSSVSIADLQEAPAGAPAPKKKAKPSAWVEPVDGDVPPTHPIKAKMASGIYHVPGGFNYARTKPDRCYLDVAAAEADGLRPSKR